MHSGGPNYAGANASQAAEFHSCNCSRAAGSYPTGPRPYQSRAGAHRTTPQY